MSPLAREVCRCSQPAPTVTDRAPEVPLARTELRPLACEVLVRHPIGASGYRRAHALRAAAATVVLVFATIAATVPVMQLGAP